MSEDVGELVIKDREVLSENGIVLISASLSKKTKEVLVGPEITTRGFIYVKDSSEIIKEIKKISLEIIEKNSTDKQVDYNAIKQEIREKLSKYFYEETESKPMIIAVIQEV
jgi:ribonuclease J